MNRKFVKILWQYIWQYRFITALFLLFSGIFASIFSLYNLEVEAVLYASGLCGIVSIVILILQFFKYYKKHNELLRIQHNITLLTDELPERANLIEADYQNMLIHLQKIRISEITKWQMKWQESIDYYTTWVHQIKAPIAVMRLILQSEDTQQHKELLSELFRIEQYTEMVLCYFRLDSSSSDFVFREYSLDEIIKKAVRKYAAQFVRKKIGLVYEETSIKVLTDEKWLGFILEQLLSNAIKYTNSGYIKIIVDKRKILTISDTGIGIEAEDLPRIFERGFTGYNGRINKKSTGLGLYLCKKAADKLSHRISVSSVVGQGSSFFIDLHIEELEIE